MDSKETDDEAVRRVLAGDKDAYRVLVLRYSPRMIAFCRSRLGIAGIRETEEEAKDLAQDVFVRAYVSLSKYRLGESFAAWLFAIAANRIKSKFWIFQKQRAIAESATKDAQDAQEIDPSEESLLRLQGESLIRALSLLPKELRLPMELYYLGELSVAETASILKLGQEAVKTRLFRGRKALKELADSKKPSGVSRSIYR
jgi:RNA polymerase sigma-70 factor (ECF subfamily)